MLSNLMLSKCYPFHFFWFLCASGKPPGPAKNYHCYSYLVQASQNGFICRRKGKYPALKTNTKVHQLTKHAKVSYSIPSLVFYEFPCVIYQNGLNQGDTKLRLSG